jgi:hypothetical protein
MCLISKMPDLPAEYQKAIKKLGDTGIPMYKDPLPPSDFNPLGTGGILQKKRAINPEYEEARKKIFAEIPEEVKEEYNKELRRWMTLM